MGRGADNIRVYAWTVRGSETTLPQLGPGKRLIGSSAGPRLRGVLVAKDGDMERVTGIGGLFFRSADTKGLSEWYATHLGVSGDPVWMQDAGPTVFAPFAQSTDYFGRDTQQWMVNFRVSDMDAMLAQLAAAGIPAETRAEWDSPEVGRFARIHDPRGEPD